MLGFQTKNLFTAFTINNRDAVGINSESGTSFRERIQNNEIEIFLLQFLEAFSCS